VFACYSILPDRSIGKPVAKPQKALSGYKTATSWCYRNPRPGYQTSLIQVVVVFLRFAICWLLRLKLRNRAAEVCSEGHTWDAFKFIPASTANRTLSTCGRRVRLLRTATLKVCLLKQRTPMLHHVCRAALRWRAMAGFNGILAWISDWCKVSSDCEREQGLCR
jgi:hypothetical protein